MGVLTDLVIASRDDAEAVAAEAVHSERWPTLDVKGFNSVSFGTLLTIIAGDGHSFDDPLLAARDMEQGPWVTHVPAAFVDAVASLADGAVTGVAERWAQTEELSAWSSKQLGELLGELKAFCVLANNGDKAMLMWMCL